MGTHLYDYLNSLERMLEGYQELSKEVLKKFGGHVQFNGCKASLFDTHLFNSSHHIFQAIYVPADDLTDPAPATTFAHLDATTVLSRGIAELGIYPAVDPLDSTSRILDPNIVGDEHYAVARDVQKVLQVEQCS